MNPQKLNYAYFFIIIWIMALFLTSACADKSTEPVSDPNQKLKNQFQAMLDNVVTLDKSIKNTVLLVEAPSINLKWKGAAGTADPQSNLKMNPDDQFRIASLGKMTLAVLVMKFVEEGSISLDDSIYHYLPIEIVSGLHVFQGNDYSKQITIRQLLNHSSGLPDYIEDGNKDENGITDFLQLLIAQPDKFWTPEETIEYTKHNLKPFFIPGNGYHYSDTEYQLLGLILQNITGKKLNVIYREKLFDPLGMKHTYMEYYDNPIPSITGRGLSHVYLSDIDYTTWISNSADWAGGGIISTTEDLNRFLRAFVNNEIFKSSQTKQQMLNWQNTDEASVYYGFGIKFINLEELGLDGFGELYGHDGFPQSFMFYWAKQNVTIVGTLNQDVSEYQYAQLVIEIINLLKK